VVAAALVLAVSSAIGVSEARPGFQAGIVADVERSRVYVLTPAETVAAIDLRSGAVVWQRQLEALPLGLHQGVLVAQRDGADEQTLGLVLLDAADGSSRGESFARLPAGVRVAVRDRMRSQFRASAHGRGSRLIVEWEHVALHKIHGVKDAGKPGATVSSGALEVDVRTGELIQLETPPAAREEEPEPYSIEPLPGDPPGRKVLRRSNAGAGAELAPLRIRENGFDLRLPSSDGRHFLASGNPHPAGESLTHWTWVVLDLRTGAEAGRVGVPVPAAPFVHVAGSIVVELPPHGFRDGAGWVDEPRQLRALDLSTGEVRWRRPVLDPTYRGSVPPAPGMPPR
jgi:hypothetical protein